MKQETIRAVERMPNIPSPYKMRDWRGTARRYDELVFDLEAAGGCRPLIWIDKARRNFDQETFGIYTVVGDPRQGPDVQDGEVHEAINALGAVLGAALAGIDKSRQKGRDYVGMCKNYFNRDNGCGIVLNATSLEAGRGTGAAGRSFWYDLHPNILFFALTHCYPGVPGMEDIMRRCADRWVEAQGALAGDYHHTCFDFLAMQPVDNGRWEEPDASAGIAWIAYAAYARFGDPGYLAAAKSALDSLEREKANPFYEVLLPFGAYTAARMNAETGTRYDVPKLLNWCFEGDSRPRPGWGVVAERWGEYDVHGLQGSLTDRGGYVFAMNTFDLAMALVPLVRYDHRFARAIGKWMLNAASAARLFYPGELPPENKRRPEYRDLFGGLIAYEGLRKTCQEALPDREISPFAQGDAQNWGPGFPKVSELSLYGSSHVGVFGGIISETDQEGILQLDCLKTDFFRRKAFPTYLYYNPYGQSREVGIDVGAKPVDLYEACSGRLLSRAARGSTRFTLEGDSAALLVLKPAES